MSTPMLLDTPKQLAGEDAAGRFNVACQELYSQWLLTVPADSKCYLNPVVRVDRRPALPKGPLKADAQLADVLFDVHSAMAALLLVKSWRTDQLVTATVASLNDWNMSAAASLVRALMETAAAFGIESDEIIAVWAQHKKTPVTRPDDLMPVREALYKASVQAFWGTRLTEVLERMKTSQAKVNVQRTNIITLVQKACKRWGSPELHATYEVLCDAVHPSWGSGECFWSECGVNDERQVRILLDRKARGKLTGASQGPGSFGSGLPIAIFSSGTWAVNRLKTDLLRFAQMVRDICLTGKIYVRSNMDYFGVVKPKDTYQSCACGSGEKTRFCIHRFGS